MSNIWCQQALDRVLVYLQGDGLELTAETCRKALRLVDEAMAEGAGPDLPARCMDLVPGHFELSDLEFPRPSPTLIRGHVRYFPHD